MQIVLYQPDIPQNTGTILRLAAALEVPVHLIEPCGFVLTDKQLKRAALDTMPFAEFHRHASWEAFLRDRRGPGRLVLMTTKADMHYTDYRFGEGDWLLFGRESAGVPDTVHASADSRLLIPISSDVRSLNLAVATAMVVGEAMRQTRWTQQIPDA